ncbi:hypothetical protein BC937DRAFT_89274 [Endogone sp. FLAS-F59071]|nr:hypothetical protein BC937DRAFT_89274 [Endogone sp. FLAS-F59071]|eukprot:RUS23281.1 hypothetical protein BC937DRAFT_89274 [Endogone sp. FLAS-F59071]
MTYHIFQSDRAGYIRRIFFLLFLGFVIVYNEHLFHLRNKLKEAETKIIVKAKVIVSTSWHVYPILSSARNRTRRPCIAAHRFPFPLPIRITIRLRPWRQSLLLWDWRKQHPLPRKSWLSPIHCPINTRHTVDFHASRPNLWRRQRGPLVPPITCAPTPRTIM